MIHIKIWCRIIFGENAWPELPRLKPPWNDLGKVMTKLPGS